MMDDETAEVVRGLFNEQSARGRMLADRQSVEIGRPPILVTVRFHEDVGVAPPPNANNYVVPLLERAALCPAAGPAQHLVAGPSQRPVDSPVCWVTPHLRTPEPVPESEGSSDLDEEPEMDVPPGSDYYEEYSPDEDDNPFAPWALNWRPTSPDFESQARLRQERPTRASGGGIPLTELYHAL